MKPPSHGANGALPCYPASKTSGVEWLDDVPEHWEVVPGRACYTSGQVPNSGLLEKTVLSLSYGQVKVRPEEKLHGLVPSSFETYQVVKPDDIICRPTDLQNDWNSLRFGLSRHKGIITSAYMCLQTRPNLSRNYGFLLLHTYDLKKVFYGLGSGLRQNLSWTDFKLLPCLVPPLAEQRSIVRYLDYVNRRIRRYVAAKRKLIALLEEERQAVVNRAVTRGLDPNVGLKPSGVEWLGGVPEHWEMRRLKTLGRIRYGLGQPPRESVDGLPLIRATNVERGRIVDRGLIRVDPSDVPASRDALLRRHEVIVVRSGAYTADSAIIPTAYDGAVAGYDLVVTATGCMAQFMAWALLSTYLRDDQLITASSRAAQPHLNAEELGASMLLVPPIYEQRAIVEHLDKATNDIDAAIARARRQVELV